MGLSVGSLPKEPKLSFDSKGINNVDKYHPGYGNRLLTASESFTKYPDFERICFKIERVSDIYSTLEKLVKELRKTLIINSNIEDEVLKAETLLLEIRNAKF